MPSVAELGRAMKAKHPGVYDAIDDARLGMAVQAKHPGVYDQFTTDPAPAAPAPTAPTHDAGPQQWDATDWRRRVLDTLPYGGAAVGGALGVGAALPEGGLPALITGPAGAAGGGAVGRGVEKIILQALGQEPPVTPQNFGAGALDLAKAGGQGALDQLMGMGIEGGLKMAGEHLAARSLRTPGMVPPKGLASAPRLAKGYGKEAIAERLPVGGGGVTGTGELGQDQATTLIRKSGAALRGMLKTLRDRKVTIDPHHIAEPVGNLIEKVNNQPLAAGDRRAIEAMTKQFFKEHPGPMDPLKVKLLKRRAQEMAQRIIKGRNAGTTPTGGIDAGEFNDAIATGARRALMALKEPLTAADRAGLHPSVASAKTFGEALGKQEARTSNLIGLRQQIARAGNLETPVNIHPLGPVRAAVIPHLSLSRAQASRAALGMTSSKIAAAARQTPRLIDLLLHQVLMGNEPDTTQGGGQ